MPVVGETVVGETLEDKKARLERILHAMKQVAVAFPVAWIVRCC